MGRDRTPVRASALLVAMVLGATGCTPPSAPSSSSPTVALTDAIPTRDHEPEVPTPPPLHVAVDDWPAALVVIDRAQGGQVEVSVRVADTPSRRRHGLMEVPTVPDGTGMLFVHEGDHDGGYWMRGTLTDLDIAWVAADGTIVAMDTMPMCEADPCPQYVPGTAYRVALEVPAGWLADHGIGVGDQLTWEPHPNPPDG